MTEPTVPEVKVGPTSVAEDLVAQAKRECVVTDARGRKITLRDPGVLAQFKLVKALGAALSENTTYLQMALPILYVGAIDGEPVYMPNTEIELDVIIGRLDGAGLEAVMSGVREHFAGNAEEAKAAAKK